MKCGAKITTARLVALHSGAIFSLAICVAQKDVGIRRALAMGHRADVIPAKVFFAWIIVYHTTGSSFALHAAKRLLKTPIMTSR